MDAALHDETERAEAAAELWLTSADGGALFDRLAAIARATLSFPIAYVSLIDARHQHIRNSLDVAVCDGGRENAICNVTIRRKEPLVLPDLSCDARFRDFPQVRGAPGLRAYWGVPLVTRQGLRVGAFCVMDHVPRHPRAVDLTLLGDFAQVAIECLELRVTATTDPLTGLQTRRAFLAEGERLFFAGGAKRPAMSCIFMDIDHFKRLNDTHGHLAGDAALRHVGALLRRELFAGMAAGRMGGEEFVMLLPGGDAAAAHALAERLRAVLKADRGRLPEPLTASFGISERRAGDGLGDMIRRADEAMYAAKQAGRDCIRPV